ncbi:MAG: hypothetical protein RR386_08440, partial [Bacteroidaceae bacterium]
SFFGGGINLCFFAKTTPSRTEQQTSEKKIILGTSIKIGFTPLTFAPQKSNVVSIIRGGCNRRQQATPQTK